MKTGKNIQCVLTLLASFLLATTLFLFLFNYDNKYTEPALEFDNGILTIDSEQLSGKPVHLIEGWKLYLDRLGTPDDFLYEESPVYRNIYIGQYPGFEAGDNSRSPHGSATYQLSIKIPPETENYTLELPEIYSAYKLYINGELMAVMGNPDPASYKPVTGNATVSFRAQESVNIILAVTDYSGFYSGLTYPPAFGKAGAVSHLLSLRFFIRLFACSAALLIGLYYLITGVLSKQGRLSILYGTMCLLFIGSVCYPIAKTFMACGPAWYQFEDFCHSAMILCVILICGVLTGMSKRIMIISFATGFLFSITALCSPLFIAQGLNGLYAFSSLMDLYSWTSAAYLTTIVAASVYKNGAHSRTILSGVAFFDCALILDRLLPRFEPIYFGWFAEVAGSALVCCFGIAMTRRNIEQTRERFLMQGHIESMEQLIDMQQRYYPVIMENINEARAARHDLRHHMRLIRELAGENNIAGLTEYLQEYHADSQPENVITYTRNYVVDTLLRHFASLAANESIRFEGNIDIPEQVNIPDSEMAIVISNLLENALEACTGVSRQDAYIKTSIRIWNNQLIIVVKNSFDGNLEKRDGFFLSGKREGAIGIGLESIRAAVKRVGGSSEFSADGSEFEASVLLMATPKDEQCQKQQYEGQECN